MCSGGVIVLLQCVMCYTFWVCYSSITVCDVLRVLVFVVVLLQCVMCYTFWVCYGFITACDVLQVLGVL